MSAAQRSVASPGTAGTGGRDPALADENTARRAIVDACLKMATLGLNPGRAGNVSLRWHRGGPRGAGMLVTPAAMPYDTMTADDVVWLPLDAVEPVPATAAAAGGQTGAGMLPSRRPSSEWRMHRDVYVARSEAGAVVHVHSPAATALACLPSVQADGIPAFHYMVAVAGGSDIRCAAYASFGSAELSRLAVAALAGRRACLLANHGTVAFGATLATALELSVELESLARMYAQVLQL
ncbi:MAG TPA: class II aldolase/adducin family protein, partial [Burkholderiaceae bacterium]|nr:class II aldolase/adducin family protein [Burkholderiaceae bacterium]